MELPCISGAFLQQLPALCKFILHFLAGKELYAPFFIVPQLLLKLALGKVFAPQA